MDRACVLRRQRGYSLTELIVVTGIVAVVTGFAVPWISNAKTETGLLSAEREVVGALYMARSGAIAYNTQRIVTIDPMHKTIRITDPGGTQYYTRNLATYGSGITIPGSNLITITFDSRGLLTPPTSSITVTLNGTANQSKTVTVYPTGKAVAS